MSKVLLRKMDFECQHCGDILASKYNLKRHMARKHDSWTPTSHKYEEKESEIESSESDKETETENEDTDNENNTTDEVESEKGEKDSESEDSDIYTYDEVQAIVRYALQTELQTEE
jgi:hypothetical protein